MYRLILALPFALAVGAVGCSHGNQQAKADYNTMPPPQQQQEPGIQPQEQQEQQMQQQEQTPEQTPEQQQAEPQRPPSSNAPLP
jgi:uncharacterized protein HemX